MKIVVISINFYSHVSTAREYGSAALFETYPQSSRSKHVPLSLVSVRRCPTASDDYTVLFNSHCIYRSLVGEYAAPWNKQAFLPLLLPIYPGKRGSHAHKWPLRTLRPLSKFRGANCVKIFVVSNFRG